MATEPASIRTLYLPYASGGRQAWQLGPGEPLQVDLPVEVGSFYGFSPLTNRMLYAPSFSDHGAGPDNIAVSDLAIYDLTAGTSETLFSDDVVEALWAPNGADLAYILATADTYEVRWRSGSGEDRLLSRDVTFNWSIDLAVPWLQLTVLATVLVAAAGLTATLSGRAATGIGAVRAVREDW